MSAKTHESRHHHHRQSVCLMILEKMLKLSKLFFFHTKTFFHEKRNSLRYDEKTSSWTNPASGQILNIAKFSLKISFLPITADQLGSERARANTRSVGKFWACLAVNKRNKLNIVEFSSRLSDVQEEANLICFVSRYRISQQPKFAALNHGEWTLWDSQIAIMSPGRYPMTTTKTSLEVLSLIFNISRFFLEREKVEPALSGLAYFLQYVLRNNILNILLSHVG
jgi:hypothetical protein